MGSPKGYSINSETDIRRNQNHQNEKIITYFVRFRKSYSKIRNLYYIYNLNCKRLADMYISWQIAVPKALKNGPTFTSRRSSVVLAPQRTRVASSRLRISLKR